MRAVLTGEPNAPVLELAQFGYNARAPGGRLLREAIKGLPDTRWIGKLRRPSSTSAPADNQYPIAHDKHAHSGGDRIHGEEATPTRNRHAPPMAPAGAHTTHLHGVS